jgi:ketosteroid isomerase-like protein
MAEQTTGTDEKQASGWPRATRSLFVQSASLRGGPPDARLAPKAAVRDTQRTMPEESTTRDLLELMRTMAAAANERDFDTADRYYAPDAVWDSSRTGVGIFEGAAAIRRLFEEWRSTFEEWEIGFAEWHAMGNGVVFSLVRQAGRPVGVTGYLRQREPWVWVWVESVITSVTTYPETDMDEARAAAERLAAERG